MVTIGVIGANGQVGSEVCLFLSRMGDVKVIPICRTKLGSVFLRRCGLQGRHGTLDSPDEAARLLADCDLVSDFSFPKGLASQVRSAYRLNITNSIQQAPRHARYVYISSFMAFGMWYRDQLVRPRILAQTTYGATKRYAERIALGQGRRLGREVYVLRLGQVHGELQSVSRSMFYNLRSETAYIPDGPSYTVFAFSVAEALLHIALGKERPGVYTLVSVPEWSWEEIHKFYACRRGIQPQVVLLAGKKETRTAWFGRFYSFLRRLFIDPIVGFATRHREIIAGYLLSAFPTIEQRLKAIYARRNAMAQISEGKKRMMYVPYELTLSGRVPGERLKTLSDSKETLEPLTSTIRQLLQTVDQGLR